MAERDASIDEAVEETGQVIETALRLDRPTAALKAIELKLKLRGIIHDRRFSLYTDSPDDDLSTCLFDPREDEDPPLEPLAQAPASPAEPPAPLRRTRRHPVPQPEPRKPQLPPSKPARPGRQPAPARPAPVLRIPPVPPRVLETFNIDAKAFPTVCPSSPEDPGSP